MDMYMMKLMYFDIDDFKEINDTYSSDNLYNLDLYYQILDSIGNSFTPF